MTRINDYRPLCATEGFNQYKVALPEAFLMVNQGNAATQSFTASVIKWKLTGIFLGYCFLILHFEQLEEPGALGQWLKGA